jgi:hypothetical protein
MLMHVHTFLTEGNTEFKRSFVDGLAGKKSQFSWFTVFQGNEAGTLSCLPRPERKLYLECN